MSETRYHWYPGQRMPIEKRAKLFLDGPPPHDQREALDRLIHFGHACALQATADYVATRPWPQYIVKGNSE